MSVGELVAVLRRPLEFASRKGFANASLADGLGPFLTGVLHRGQGLAVVEERADELAHGLPEWGTASPEVREEVVRRWNTLLSRAAGRETEADATVTATAPPQPTARRGARAKPPTRKSSETVVAAATRPAKARTAPDLSSAKRRRGPLDTPVIRLKGVGPKIADKLAVRGLRTVRDVLWFLPRRYSVRPPVRDIGALEEGCDATVVGWVQAHRGGWAKRGRRPSFRLELEDATGSVGVRFFGLSGGFLTRRFPLGQRVFVAGQVQEYRDRLEFTQPEAVPLEEGEAPEDAAGRISPVYLEVDGVAPGTLRRIIGAALDEFATTVPDGVPHAIAHELGLPSAAIALELVHRPATDAASDDVVALRSPAWRRLIFEELFIFQVGIALRRRATQLGTREGHERHAPVLGSLPNAASSPTDAVASLLKRFLAALPFELTGAQRRTLAEIRCDLALPIPMNRLLQGDVGCGKTAVAMAAAAVAVGAGAQVAVMAPTELLAEQHLRTFGEQLGGESVGVRVAALFGGMRKRAREAELRGLLSGSTDVVVGTHALIQDDVAFRRLGLVIVDEQHRFGVRQRLALRQKGTRPHVLVMTATPIPRSLSLTLYGDLDVSVIDERPPGRGTVTTEVLPEDRRGEAYVRVREQLDAGRQAYFVYPVVGDAGLPGELGLDGLDGEKGLVGEVDEGGVDEDTTPLVEGVGPGRADELRAATSMVEELRVGALAGYEVGLIHGRMSSDDKDAVMAGFTSGRIRALVATTVIEVGIDVPAATVMVVEHAERFGLAQLHQLRGRIGRGGDGRPSLCLLIVSDTPGRLAEERLRTLERTEDGFEIAEADLVQRGPGEFLGTRQSGMPKFEVADLLRDGDVLREAREAAFDLVRLDPTLRRHPGVLDAVQERWAGNVELVEVG